MDRTVVAEREPPTARQRVVLQAIKDVLALGESPTLGRIGEWVGLATTTVHEHVQALIERGYLKRTMLGRIAVVDEMLWVGELLRDHVGHRVKIEQRPGPVPSVELWCESCQKTVLRSAIMDRPVR